MDDLEGKVERAELLRLFDEEVDFTVVLLKDAESDRADDEGIDDLMVLDDEPTLDETLDLTEDWILLEIDEDRTIDEELELGGRLDFSHTMEVGTHVHDGGYCPLTTEIRLLPRGEPSPAATAQAVTLNPALLEGACGAERAVAGSLKMYETRGTGHEP